MSVRRVALLATIAVALIACAAYGAGRLERDSAVRAAQRMQQSQDLLTAMLDEETGARGFFETDRRALLAPWYEGETRFARALAASRRLDAGDRDLSASVDVQAVRSGAWHTAVAGEIALRLAGARPPGVGQALADKTLFDRFRAANTAYLIRLVDRRNAALAAANWLTAGLIGVLTIALVLIAGFAARRSSHRVAAQAERQRELRELMQVSASESESQQLLIRHVERIVPGAAAAVLDRNETEDRLDAVLGGDAPAGPLEGVQVTQLRRRSCMAVRLNRTYGHHPGADPLLACEVCGHLSAEVACEPLVVGGRVIGAVLLAHEKRITPDQHAQLRESVVQAAPILANQRNLELAEWRAASDALTGLPNRRAAEEAIRRMAAHAGRTLSPLAVLLVDLDRFKQINDRHGHDQGDQVLAVIGQVLTTSIRASDFAARYGGEEFLILLPDTDRTGAVDVAEKIRHAIEHAEVPGIGSLTASLGVAALPEDAVGPDQLIRKADRALYAAKALGRNRVQPAQPSGAGDLPSDGDDLLGGPGGALGEN